MGRGCESLCAQAEARRSRRGKFEMINLRLCGEFIPQLQCVSLELAAKKCSLTSLFCDDDLHISDRGREILPHPAFNLAGNIFSQQLGARVGNRQKDYV